MHHQLQHQNQPEGDVHDNNELPELAELPGVVLTEILRLAKGASNRRSAARLRTRSSIAWSGGDSDSGVASP